MRSTGRHGARDDGRLERWTRRHFLGTTASGAASLALGWAGARAAAAGETLPRDAAASAIPGARGDGLPTARVVLVRDPDVVTGTGTVNAELLSRMLDEAVAALADGEDPVAAWRGLLAEDDVLGVKSNVWPSLPTPPALEEAVVRRALDVGIPESRISVRDRGILDDPVFLQSTALINVRPLRIHHWAGIGGCLKNYIMFVREPWRWHDDACADLGGLWKLPVCKGKTRLNILVVLTPQFHGIGPHHFDPAYVWTYGGLLVSHDPVAVDALGVKLLAEKRRRFFDPPPRGGTSTKHVGLAETRHAVGVADLPRIELIRMGWMEESLI